MEPDGYASDQERTIVDDGYAGLPAGAEADAERTAQGVVTPHASFLALRYAPEAALANLANLREDFDAYGPGGFYDAINVSTGEMSRALPVARPGHGDGRSGQRAGRRRTCARAFSPGPMEERGRASDADGGVHRWSDRHP